MRNSVISEINPLVRETTLLYRFRVVNSLFGGLTLVILGKSFGGGRITQQKRKMKRGVGHIHSFAIIVDLKKVCDRRVI